MSTRSSSNRHGRRSGSPSCAWRSGASTTRLRCCARNGPSSTLPPVSRPWQSGICPCNQSMASSTTGSTGCRNGRPTWCRPMRMIRSGYCSKCPTFPRSRRQVSARPKPSRRQASARPKPRGSAMNAPAAPVPDSAPPVAAPPKQSWRRGLTRALLYGNVDRAAKAKARVGLAILVFAAGYAVIAGRLVMFAAVPNSNMVARAGADAVATARPDILDRGGEILATDVRVPSLFAEPHRIIDVDDAVELLTAVLPDLDATEVRKRLSSKRRFVWLKREITPKQRGEIYRLGLPGIGFLSENNRVYPNGAGVSHLIGHVNIDNQGIAGIEKWLDGRGLADLHLAGLATDRLQQPVELAVDLRVQHGLRDELIKARDKFKAKAAAGLLSDVRTGEIVAMLSVPDYDRNSPREALDPSRINRLNTRVYQM